MQQNDVKGVSAVADDNAVHVELERYEDKILEGAAFGDLGAIGHACPQYTPQRQDDGGVVFREFPGDAARHVDLGSGPVLLPESRSRHEGSENIHGSWLLGREITRQMRLEVFLGLCFSGKPLGRHDPGCIDQRVCPEGLKVVA